MKNGNRKSGAALLIALVIMMFLAVLGLSLVTVSFHLFGTVSGRQDMEQCRELVQSFSRVLEQEIAGPRFESDGEQAEAQANGQHALWFYLRENVLQGGWPYYKEKERGHGLADPGVCRTFTLDLDEDTGAEMTVEFYWENAGEADADAFRVDSAGETEGDAFRVDSAGETEGDAFGADGIQEADVDAFGAGEDGEAYAATLSVRVVCAMGQKKSVLTSIYGLRIQDEQGAWQWELLSRR